MYKRLLMLLLIAAPGFGAFAQERLKANGEMPVLAWMGVPDSETTIERFNELKASGININYSNYSSVKAVEKALDVAGEAGVMDQWLGFGTEVRIAA